MGLSLTNTEGGEHEKVESPERKKKIRGTKNRRKLHVMRIPENYVEKVVLRRL